MTDLSTTLAALSEAYIKSSHHTPYAAFIAAYRNGHLIVKPDREVLREKVARAIFFRGDPVNETQWEHMQAFHRTISYEMANAALTAIFGGGDE